jgi:CHAD domain-containing protein
MTCFIGNLRQILHGPADELVHSALATVSNWFPERVSSRSGGEASGMAKKSTLEAVTHNATVQVVAAGAVASGGALAAGKLVRDRVAERAMRRRTRFRLAPDEGAADGLRRIARGQIELASDRLESGDDVAEAVHEARKSLKRLRAVVRLARDPLGDEIYRSENRAYRDTGRELSAARDAQVLGETLDALTDRYRREIDDDAFAGLREAIAADAKAAHERIAADAGAVEEVRAGLGAARDRVPTWPLPEDEDASMLAPGFERIYKRGRRALKAARQDPSDESMHELRKRAKDLWHASQILRPVSPRRMKRLARRAHALSDLLGDDHDLAVLLDAARERYRTLGRGELALLRALVGRRRARLQRAALACGRRVYGPKPRVWTRRIAKGAAAHA